MTLGEADLLLKSAGFKYVQFMPCYSYDILVFTRGHVECMVWRTNSASSEITEMCRTNTKAGVDRALAESGVADILELCP